jgi:tetratricopeptide (TPR) repeat protein
MKTRSDSGKKQTNVPESVRGGWIHGPALDLIVGCGAWSAPLLLLAYPLGTRDEGLASFAFYALALVFNYPHFMATIYRAYRTKEEFSRYRVFTVHLTLLALATIVVAHWAYWMVPWVFTIYVTWSPWHYTGQNFGLSMMFARRNGATPLRAVRRALHLSFWASYLLIFIRFHTGPSGGYLISLGLPESLTKPASVGLAIAFLGLGFWSLRAMIRQVGARAMAPVLVLFGTQFLWFVAPLALEIGTSSRLPQTLYSSGILAVMHAAQYMWITSYYTRRETEASGQRWRPWLYFIALVVGGIALFIPGPWIVSYVFKFDFTASFVIFTSLVNIHHFLLDGALWKLRDGRIAALLLNARDKVSAEAVGVSRSIGRTARWITGGHPFARTIRVTAVALLLMLAGLDLARSYLGFSGQSAARLARAESLNPYDQKVLLRLAREQGYDGNLERTISTLERAIRTNPENEEAQNQLAQLLIKNELYERAFEHCKQMVRHLPDDVNGLVNFGILASQLGHEDDAIQSWERALSLDPSQKNVRLYLADAYEKKDKIELAIPQYERYLALLSEQEGPPLDPKEIIGLTLKLALYYGRQNKLAVTLQYAGQAATLASQAGEKASLSAAFSTMAQALIELGKPADALPLYQRCIQLDRETGDSLQEGLDWFKYGQFLKRSQQPDRLTLACLIKADGLVKSSEVKERALIAEARSQEETAMGAESASVTRDLDSIIVELLAPQPST